MATNKMIEVGGSVATAAKTAAVARKLPDAAWQVAIGQARFSHKCEGQRVWVSCVWGEFWLGHLWLDRLKL